jgi:uncharacterized phage-associated protein
MIALGDSCRVAARARFHLVAYLGPLIREIIHGSGPFVMSDCLPTPAYSATHDPRSVCNAILDDGVAAGRSITNLALQKLLYFVHGLHLVERKRPLVSGFFEAWQFGPVHPIAYRAFKAAGAAPILFRAQLKDPFGDAIELPECTDLDVLSRIRRVVTMYAGMTPGRLVEISHAKGAPWRSTVEKARNETVIGLRISNDLIAERFKHHKVSIGPEPRHGEPSEECPFE